MKKSHNNYFFVIKLLLENPEEEFSILKISKRLGLDYKSVYNVVSFLEKNNVLGSKLFGKAKRIFLKNFFHPFVFETEFFRREELLRKDKDLNVIYQKLFLLKFPFIVLLFGSRLVGKRKNSDIDLLIVCDDKHRSELQDLFDLFPLNLDLNFFSFEEFNKALLSKEFSVVQEAVKKNIILIGVEDYYRLVHNS